MCSRKLIAVNTLQLNDHVCEVEETLWGVKSTVETVTRLVCLPQDHMVEIELRVGSVLKHIRRYSPEATVRVV